MQCAVAAVAFFFQLLCWTKQNIVRGCRTQTASAKSALLEGQLVLDWHLINMRWELELRELRELQKHCKQYNDYNARTKHWTQSVLWDGNSYNEQRMLWDLWGYISQIFLVRWVSETVDVPRRVYLQFGAILAKPWWRHVPDSMKVQKGFGFLKGSIRSTGSALPRLHLDLHIISLHSSNFSLFSSFFILRSFSSNFVLRGSCICSAAPCA